MNNVVLKGKLGAGFNDDRYTLPKDGNPGDILVKTETGSAWEKQKPVETLPKDGNPGDILVKTETGSAWQKHEPSASGGRVFVTGTMVKKNGINYISTNQTQEQIIDLYNSGKEVVLETAIGESDVIRALYNGTLFYSIMTMSAGNTINSVFLTVFGKPIIYGQQTLWAIGEFEIMRPE